VEQVEQVAGPLHAQRDPLTSLPVISMTTTISVNSADKSGSAIHGSAENIQQEFAGHFRTSSEGSPRTTSSSGLPPPPEHMGFGSADDTHLPSAMSKGTFLDLRRFSSLPRTPSLTSGPHSVDSRSSRPPSLLSRARPKIRSHWPDAMWCKDIVAKRGAVDRAMGYANKINELAMYDCGLSDWIAATKERG